MNLPPKLLTHATASLVHAASVTLALLQSWSTFLLQQCIASRECVLGNISFCWVGWGVWVFSSIYFSFRSADGPVSVLKFFWTQQLCFTSAKPMPFITLSLAALTGDSQYLSGEEVYCTTQLWMDIPCSQMMMSLYILHGSLLSMAHLLPSVTIYSVGPSASIQLLLSKLDNPHLQLSCHKTNHLNMCIKAGPSPLIPIIAETRCGMWWKMDNEDS